MTSPALRLVWKIVVAGFAIWGFVVTLLIFAYRSDVLPAGVQRSIRAAAGGASRTARPRQPRSTTPRQNASERAPQQLPPVDSVARGGASRAPQQLPPVDPESDAESDDDAEPAPAAERGHRAPPHD